MAEGTTKTRYTDRYKVLKSIGEGQFGKVFLCEDLENNHVRRALKKMLIHSDNMFQSVKQEAGIICKLQHPGVLQYFDLYQEYFHQHLWLILVTEYCEGGDLRAVIEKRITSGAKRSEEKDVRNMTVQLAMALEYIHQRGIIHRDLKPENIFVCNDVLKIGDFGVSRILQETVVAQTMCGTFHYMAPEMFSTQGHSFKADVWSLGCIVYELCTMKKAFGKKGVFMITAAPIPVLPFPTFSSILTGLVKWTLERDVHIRMSASDVVQKCIDNDFMTAMKDSVKEEFLQKRKESRSNVSRDRLQLTQVAKTKKEGTASKADTSLTPTWSSGDSGLGSHLSNSGAAFSGYSADVSSTLPSTVRDRGFQKDFPKSGGRRHEQPHLNKNSPTEFEEGFDDDDDLPTAVTSADIYYESDFEPGDEEEQGFDGPADEPDGQRCVPLGLQEKIKCIEKLTEQSKEEMGEKKFNKAHKLWTQVLKEMATVGNPELSVEHALKDLEPPPDSLMMVMLFEQQLSVELEQD